MSEEKKIKVAGIVNDSITDGPGLRFTLFVQGCKRRCEGCHNPETQSFEGGEYKTVEEIFEKIKKNPLLSGVTLSGGEPFCQAEALIPLCEMLKKNGYEIAAYTGNTFEELLKKNDREEMKLLSLCDVLVDGEFIKAKRNLSLLFRGSENQRILNVRKSLETSGAVLEDSDRWNGR